MRSVFARAHMRTRRFFDVFVFAFKLNRGLFSVEPVLGLSWASPGLSWAAPGLSWAFLGFSWALLGSPGPLLGPLGLSWALLGLSCALLFWTTFGLLPGPPGLSSALLAIPGLSRALLGLLGSPGPLLGSPGLFWAFMSLRLAETLPGSPRLVPIGFQEPQIVPDCSQEPQIGLDWF